MEQARGGVFAFEGYTLDLTRGCVRNTTGEIELRPKSFELLSYLVANAGRLISKEELVNAVWPDVIVTDDSLAQCVSDVRRALNDSDRQIIKTVPRRGYAFTAAVSLRPRQSEVSQLGVGTSNGAEHDFAADRAIAPGLASSKQQSRRGFGLLRAAGVVLGIGIASWWAWPYRNPPAAPAPLPSGTSPQSHSAVTTAPAPRLSIVVLPLTNLSNDPEQEYFADGITDDLTADLSRISGSFVIAHTTAIT